MDLKNERESSRTNISWKVEDIIGQFEEIEKMVKELPLSNSDENFINNMHSVKSTLEIYFSNWKRGTNEDR